MSDNENTGTFEMQRAAGGGEVRLAMQSLWLSGRLLPVGARLMVVHTFRSAEAEPVEVVYAFGLPRDAALRRFRITGRGFQARSELRPVEEARKTYEGAVEQGHLATLARTYRDGRVNLSLGNLRPGEEVRVWLELVAGVELQDDGFRFRFPFALAPCYHREARMVEVEPGTGEIELPFDRFDDVLLPRWMSDDRQLHRVAFDLRVVWPGRPDEVGSPSHGIRVSETAIGGMRVASGRSSDVPNRDLVLDVRARHWTGGVFGGALGDKGRCATVVVPSRVFGAVEAGPRSVVFLLDRSGSMGGEPLEQAKRGLRACLGALGAQDRFGIVVFDSAPEAFRPALQPATPVVRQAALKFLDAVEVQGGTELAAGVQAAAQVLGRKGGDVFVLTDGQVAETEVILRTARASGVRLHCLGIGSASQDRFLTLLARETSGASRFVTPRERVDLEAVALFAGVGRPVTEDVVVRFEGVKCARVVVEPPRHVHAGQPWVGMVEAPRAGRGGIELQWRERGEPRTWKMEWPTQGTEDAATVRLLQGARRITDVEGRLEAEPGTAGGEAPEAKRLRRELAALGREYELANRELSLVAVVERADDDASGVPKTVVVPVGLPEDLLHRAYFDPSTRQLACAMFCSLSSPSVLEDAAAYAQASSPIVRGFRRASLAPRRPLVRLTDQSSATLSRSLAADPEVRLMECAGSLEADGGLPGPDEEARVLRTALFLCCLLMRGYTCDHGTFRQHVRRVVAFLEDPARRPASPAQWPILEHLIAHAKDDQPLPETHFEWAASQLAADNVPATFWKKLARELALPV